jgi:uncharacterized damage-inducible protein DinB
MMISAEVLRLHLAYSAWASGKLLEAAAQLSGDELNRDFQTADRSVLGTLVHVFAADRVWLARLRGEGPGPFITDADRSFPVLEREWPRIQDGWNQWGAALTDASINEPVSYRDLKGRAWTQPLWQPVLHVVNHATHHRGQAAGFLRAMGHEPPALDLIFYYRTL